MKTYKSSIFHPFYRLVNYILKHKSGFRAPKRHGYFFQTHDKVGNLAGNRREDQSQLTQYFDPVSGY